MISQDLQASKRLTQKKNLKFVHKLNSYLAALINCVETLKLSNSLTPEDISIIEEIKSIIWNIKDMEHEHITDQDNYKDIRDDQEALVKKGKNAILLIENDSKAMESTKRIFLGLNYKVTCIKGFQDALKVLKQDNQQFDLIFLDLDKFDLPGEHALLQLEEVNPSIKVLVAKTGQLPEEMSDIFKKNTRCFISKPFNDLDISMNIGILFEDKEIFPLEQAFKFNKSILVVDDDHYVRNFLLNIFIRDGWQVSLADDGEKALKLIEKNSYSIILLDIFLPKINGLDILQKIKKMHSEAIVIVITGAVSMDTAIQALKLGAFDYVMKPVFSSEIKIIIQKALKKLFYFNTKVLIEDQPSIDDQFEGIVGSSDEMKKLFFFIERYAKFDDTILVLGETGTGKELVAKALHNKSLRKDRPFVIVDCASFSESLIQSELFGHVKGAFTGALNDKKGYFEAGEGGTVFFDEIGELSMSLQTKLLRFLQTKEYTKVGETKKRGANVRIIAATNRDLQEEVKAGRFRLDLYTRLNVLNVKIPPLRNRIEDIPLLANYFIVKYSSKLDKQVKISAEALRELKNHTWPGNVRELENEIRRALALSDETILRTYHFSHTHQYHVHFTCEEINHHEDVSYKEAKDRITESFDRSFLTNLLKKNNGNISAAAKQAKMSRSTIHFLLSKYNINH